jgi:plasmid maintenance system antidote protein VapI
MRQRRTLGNIMDIADYIHKRKKIEPKYSDRKLAKELNLPPNKLSQFKNYKLPLSTKLALKLEEITNGEVDAWEMIKEFHKRKEKDG